MKLQNICNINYINYIIIILINNLHWVQTQLRSRIFNIQNKYRPRATLYTAEWIFSCMYIVQCTYGMSIFLIVHWTIQKRIYSSLYSVHKEKMYSLLYIGHYRMNIFHIVRFILQNEYSSHCILDTAEWIFFSLYSGHYSINIFIMYFGHYRTYYSGYK